MHSGTIQPHHAIAMQSSLFAQHRPRDPEKLRPRTLRSFEGRKSAEAGASEPRDPKPAIGRSSSQARQEVAGATSFIAHPAAAAPLQRAKAQTTTQFPQRTRRQK
jgi:hypothetical protein